MLKKNKKNLLLAGGLLGALIASSAAGIALSSCTSTSTVKPTDTETEYTTQINWNDSNTFNSLTKDEQGLYYSDESKTNVIALDPNSAATTITLPSTVTTISGYVNVTGTGDSQTSTQTGAFQNNTKITSITVQSGAKLVTIDKLAFSGCTALTSISDTTGVTKIGTSAFSGCTALKTITLNKAQFIGKSAFSGAFSSTEADVTITLSNVLSIATGAFYNSNITSVSIGTTSSLQVGITAFQGCTRLATVEFTNTANNTPISLGYGAFTKCSALTTLTFPSTNANKSNLITIGQSAFDGCTSLVTTHLGNVGVVGPNAFEGCGGLTTVTLPANSNSVLTTIGSLAFNGCSSLTTVAPLATNGSTQATGFVSTDSMAVIGAYAFSNTAIASIDLTNFKGTTSNGATITGSVKSFSNIKNLATVNLGSTITTLDADNKQQGLFYNSGTSGDGFDLVLPSSITTINAGALAGSGVKSIDMSKVTSYSTTSGSEQALPSYLFKGATKLETVILKPGTTSVGDYSFQNCSSLKWVKNPTSASDTTALTTNGFTAGTTVTSVGTGAFAGAFTESANATVDLSEMTFTNVPGSLFDSSNVATLKLPSTITTIPASSFNNMTNLSDVNFNELTDLTSIAGNNFTNTKLKTIDLSNITGSLSFTGVSSSAPLFTGLPTECVVSLPSTMSSFSGVFMSTSGSPVAFNFPKGLALEGGFSTVANGVLTFTPSNQQASNLRSVDLAANTTVTSIGTNTFFGNTKLTSLTLSAKSLNTSSVLFTGGSITAGTSNTSTPSSYATASVPFGNNTAFTNLNYANFASSGTSTTTSQQALFETTTADTWNAVAKIVNSLSNYSYVQSDATSGGTKLPTNLSTWAAESSSSRTSKILEDSVITTSNGSNGKLSSIVFNNCFSASGSSGIGNITIGATLASNTFIHNGILWTYTNNGTSITLTGQANMYKVTSNNSSYLTFFNTQQVQAQASGNESVTYNIPNQTKVAISLVIATKAAA